MRGITRSLTALALSGGVALLAPVSATAAPTPHDPDAASAAAEYVAAQLVDGQVPEDAGGGTADAVLALLATGGDEQLVGQATDWLEQQAATYAGDGGPAAAKLAVVAAATGRDATDFGGVDLLAGIEESLTAEGQCGEFGYAYGQALCALGLQRNDADVPAGIIDTMLTFQDESGAFGDDSSGSFAADLDGSALALTALAVADHPEATESAVAVRDYLVEAQTDDSYWEGFSPVNTTAMVGSALTLVGEDTSEAVDWLAGQQLDDGGFPATLDGNASDLLATTQAAVFLGGESMLSVGEGGEDRVELPAGAAPGGAGAGADDGGDTTAQPGEGTAGGDAAVTQTAGAADPAATGDDAPTTGGTVPAGDDAAQSATPGEDDVAAGSGDEGGGGWGLWALLGIAAVALVGLVLALANRGRERDAAARTAGQDRAGSGGSAEGLDRP